MNAKELVEIIENSFLEDRDFQILAIYPINKTTVRIMFSEEPHNPFCHNQTNRAGTMPFIDVPVKLPFQFPNCS